jgi:hypothetical protein
MKYWLKLLALLLPVVVVALFIAHLFRAPLIAYERIQDDMTMEEVEAVLGPPTWKGGGVVDIAHCQWRKPGWLIQVDFLDTEWPGPPHMIVYNKKIRKCDDSTLVWLRRTFGM